MSEVRREVANIKGISIKENKLGLSDAEAIHLLGAIACAESEGWDPLWSDTPDNLKLRDNNELLDKLGIPEESREAFESLWF